MIKTKRPIVATTPYALRKEAKKATQMLKGKIVHRILRSRPDGIVIQFTDGTTLFVDMVTEDSGLDLSITRDGTRDV
jgi:hypothetical protein